MLRAAVFDLDRTLFDPGTLPHELFTRLEAHVRAKAADLVPAATMDAAFVDVWHLPFDQVVARHQLPMAVRAAWQEAASALEVTTPLAPYADVVTGLEQLSLHRFLLTTGFRRLQESKVRPLGLMQLFVALYVDALEPPGPVGKQALLERLLLEYELTPAEVVVIGDRADDELAAARRLGMVAVQVLRPGVVPSLDVPLRIADLRTLPALLARFAGP